ncbi:MAG: hypothetical protein KA260_12885 [Burkholderiales bacterium]|mgnify:CR=1 FL=1|jgi:hypothetical protein|nr:hypothetical protein [Burkholderiales bacterium]
MKNITISVADELAHNLRIASAQANKSLSRFLAETLEQTLFGKPADATVARRIGVAAGEFVVPDSIDEANADVAALFTASPRTASNAKQP